MERRSLGTTGLQISVVGFGSWAAGSDHNPGGSLGRADDDESIAAIHRAIDLGVNWIDTAPGYGVGHSEAVVARAVRGMAERPLVFTKCGFVWNERRELAIDISPDSLRWQVEASLRRLEVDAIDLMQIHWLEPENDPQLEDGWATLVELREQGKLRHIGVSNLTVAQLVRAAAIAPVETLQPPYSLLQRSIESETLPYCIAADVGVIVYSPMQTGLLTGAMTRERIAALPPTDVRLIEDPNYVEPRLTESLAFVERLTALATSWDSSPAEVAVAWTIAQPGVTGAIVGFRRPVQVEQVLGRNAMRLSEAQLSAIAQL
jgi:aryl-alcohol dehydrogenase-like predicted oxidoreductase